MRQKSALLLLAGALWLLGLSRASAQNITCGPTETPVTLTGPGPAKLLACTPETTPPSWKVSVNGQITDLGVLTPAGPRDGAGLTPYLLPVTFAVAGTYTVMCSSYNTAGETISLGTITVTVSGTAPQPPSTMTETGTFSNTSTTGTVTVNVTANANARLVAMISGDKSGSGQTTAISGGNVGWTLPTNGQANAGGGVAAIWSGVTSTALTNAPITCKLLQGTFFVRCQIVALDGSAGVGAVAKASWVGGSPASSAKVPLVPQAAGSFVYGTGTDFTTNMQPRVVIAGQTKTGESLAANAGVFWMQKLTAPTATTASLSIGTSAPNVQQWNFVAMEVKTATGPPPSTCTYAVTPTQIAAPADAISAPVTVGASAPDCAWSASSDQSWVTMNPLSGAGNGAVTVNVASSASFSPRTATLLIAGQTVTVNQAGDQAPTANGTGIATFAVSASDDRGIVSVACLVDGNETSSITVAPYLCSVGTATGTHTVSARVTDTSGQTAVVTLGTVVR